MTQRQKSLKVPDELMGHFKEFHKTRSMIYDAQEVLQKENAKLDAEFKAAILALTKTLVAAEMVAPSDIYYVDTRYLDELGVAFIRIDLPELDTPDTPTTH